jgi:hypothetical protein
MNKWGRIAYIASTVITLIVVLVVTIKEPVIGLVILAVFVTIEYGLYRFIAKPVLDARKLAQTGEAAQARILSIEDTGVTLNTSPQVKLLLEVKPAGGEPYQVETKSYISRLDVPMFQPGKLIAVTIDPKDRKRVVVGNLSGDATVASEEVVDQSKEMLDNLEKVNNSILESGTSSTAVVLEAWSLGFDVNGNNPAMQFFVEVRPAGRKPFRASATCVVAEASVPKFQPGQEITVKYDPDDLTRVAVEHSGT